MKYPFETSLWNLHSFDISSKSPFLFSELLFENAFLEVPLSLPPPASLPPSFSAFLTSCLPAFSSSLAPSFLPFLPPFLPPFSLVTNLRYMDLLRLLYIYSCVPLQVLLFSLTYE
jgi:hypothetical protein